MKVTRAGARSRSHSLLVEYAGKCETRADPPRTAKLMQRVFTIVDIVIVMPDNVDIVNSKLSAAAGSTRIIGLGDFLDP